MNWPILSVVTFLPLFGALLVMLLVRGNERLARGTARWVALWTTLVTFAISLVMVWHFDASSAEFQFVEKLNWLGIASYHMGVDGISLPFVILTTALMPLCILASWTVIQTRVKEYMIAFLVLETLMVGTFSALDLILFYLFFEGGLIPMFLIIGIWGGPRRVYASRASSQAKGLASIWTSCPIRASGVRRCRYCRGRRRCFAGKPRARRRRRTSSRLTRRPSTSRSFSVAWQSLKSL